MRVPQPLLVSALLLALAVRAETNPPLAVRDLPSPAKPASGQPNLAVSSDGRVFLSWIEPAGEKRHALRFAERRSGGAWSEPRTIAEGAGWFVNWADFPALAVLPDGTLFAHWLAKSGSGTYAYDVRVSVSRDAGRSWSPSVVPHRDGTQAEHGFVSMAPSSTGQLDLVWLDGRKTAGAAAAGHAGGHGEMSLLHTTLARDGRLGVEAVLDGRVCDCCQTDMARAEGATVLVYRDRSDKEVRDIAVVRLTKAGWSAPRTLAADGWEINGCPVNGPALAASGGHVAVAWFTMAGGKPRVKIAFSPDSGANFGQPAAVDDGRPLGRVDVILLDAGAALVSWLEQTEKGAELRVRRMRADGTRDAALSVADVGAARSSGFPRMAASQGEVTIAWRDDAESRVRTAVLTASKLATSRVFP
jgi:hypothetical protein